MTYEYESFMLFKYIVRSQDAFWLVLFFIFCFKSKFTFRFRIDIKSNYLLNQFDSDIKLKNISTLNLFILSSRKFVAVQ